jgi:hypothetical protein
MDFVAYSLVADCASCDGRDENALDALIQLSVGSVLG